MMKLLKNTVFLLSVIGFLASAALAASVFAFKSAATVAQMSTQAVATAAQHKDKLAALTATHRKQIAANAATHKKNVTKAVAKTKAKARLRRVATMVPFAGAAAGVYFEERDYNEWIAENPDGTRKQYLCEVAELSSEFVDDVFSDLPEKVRPPEDMLTEFVPDCSLIEVAVADDGDETGGLMARVQGYVSEVDLPSLQEYVPDIDFSGMASSAKGYLPKIDLEGAKATTKGYLNKAREAVTGSE